MADRLRPQDFSAIMGQDHLLGEGGSLSRLLAHGQIPSLILWGPPGCGKTTLARLLAEKSSLHFVQLSAILSGVADLRKVFDEAQARRQNGQGTLLFVDEIHRFNRAQQDSFLPHVESGVITLIGATTENPSFELNGALLSRCQVFILKRLDDAALEGLLLRAEDVLGQPLPLMPEARAALVDMADGDGRYLLGMLENVLATAPTQPLSRDDLSGLLQKRVPLYDKAQEGHYNLISALHKSLRGSDADAALYWFARMITAGEDPRYIARRLIRFASEDVGLADPDALAHTLAANEAYERLGSPEGELNLAHAVLYLATAPKSNAAYVAYKAAIKAAKETGSVMPPAHILNAPTKLMKNAGYGAGYAYDHDTPDGFSGQNYFPDTLPRQNFYRPVERGFEREILKRLAYWDKLRTEKNRSS